jgi:outer membrane biosynthesis protein TonB
MANTADARWSPGERQSFAIVAVVHLLLLGGLSLALRSVTPPPAPDEGVPVEIVTAAEARAIAAPPPAPAPPAPEAPEPAPPPAAASPPEPASPPKAEETKPIDDAAPRAKTKPQPNNPRPEKPKAEKPEPKPLDIAALTRQLDKATPKAKPFDPKALAKSLDAAIPKAKPFDPAALSKSLDAALPKAAALPKRGDPRVAAGIAAAIKAQVTPCWTLPVGGGATAKVTALLHIAINRDGSIAGRPGLVSQTGVTAANAAYARAFAEAASRAVLRCAPLKLPADQYDQWAAVEINFDPSNF